MELWRGERVEETGYRTADEYLQIERFTSNNNNRIPICFCVDVSGSMNESIGLFGGTRIMLLKKVMSKLLQAFKDDPKLSERACVCVVSYAKYADTTQTFLDAAEVDPDRATTFVPNGQTRFSEGLNRALREIDNYQNQILDSDNITSTPILIFMTDGEPVGEFGNYLQNVYTEIHRRLEEKALHVFPIGISKQARMDYLNALTPGKEAYQMIKPDDFEKVFDSIREIVRLESRRGPNETVVTEMASNQENTMDTGSGQDLYAQVIANLGSSI